MSDAQTPLPIITETIHVETKKVACDGGGGALGHPLVYLTIGADGHVVCPYCSRDYVLKK